jgi:hypothetical protein
MTLINQISDTFTDPSTGKPLAYGRVCLGGLQ